MHDAGAEVSEEVFGCVNPTFGQDFRILKFQNNKVQQSGRHHDDDQKRAESPNDPKRELDRDWEIEFVFR